MLKILRLALVAVAVCGVHPVIAAEEELVPLKPAELKAAYLAQAKLPDWSGVWVAVSQPSLLKTTEDVALVGKFATQFAALRRNVQAGGASPASNPNCLPYGMPMFMEQRGPTFDILYAPGKVLMQSGYHETRIIYTDGRKLPAEPDFKLFDGTSVGHWEGDTLVVNTDGILPDAQFLPGLTGSPDLRIVERIRLTAPDTLRDQITLSDSKVFSRPFTYTRAFMRHRDWDVTEYACLPGKSVDYGVGLKMTSAELKASTTQNPPVREYGKPAVDAATRPGGTWALIPQLPDFTGGIWTMDRGQPNEHHTTEAIPLIPAYAKQLAEIRRITIAGGDVPTNNYHCWPRGPNMNLKAGQMGPNTVPGNYFIYIPGEIVILSEGGEDWHVYMDGRPHPDHIVPSFYGHSIGHWEGDTLVIDTIGFRADSQTMNGQVNGGNMHMVTRFRSPRPGKLTSDVTLTAVAFSAPWNYKRIYSLNRDYWIREGFCSQNNRDVDPNSGKQTFSLMPPPP